MLRIVRSFASAGWWTSSPPSSANVLERVALRNLNLEFSGLHYCLFVKVHELLHSSNGEGGIWTLAPLLTTCTLSRGVPSASWVLLHTKLIQSIMIRRREISVSNGESGIRTHAPLRTNGFQDRLVMTTSISLHAFRFISGKSYSSKK